MYIITKFHNFVSDSILACKDIYEFKNETYVCQPGHLREEVKASDHIVSIDILSNASDTYSNCTCYTVTTGSPQSRINITRAQMFFYPVGPPQDIAQTFDPGYYFIVCAVIVLSMWERFMYLRLLKHLTATIVGYPFALYSVLLSKSLSKLLMRDHVCKENLKSVMATFRMTCSISPTLIKTELLQTMYKLPAKMYYYTVLFLTQVIHEFFMTEISNNENVHDTIFELKI